MSFHLQTITICCIFVCLMCLQEGQTQQFNVYHRRDTEPKMDEGDPTKGLSDAEIDMALDDLSLADLKMLSQLIDKPDAPDYDYVDYDSRNYALGPPRDRTFDDNPIDDEINKNYYDDIDEPQRDTRNLMHFKIPRQNLLPFMEQTENQRTKRENGHEIKQATVDAEYIRQLENSFPRDQEQNNEEGGEKKEHIRVKRN
ncbi:uncharacterized protein LOC128864352 [Anastrepha ludens]|uniref:uncharacterized protein LOC128864352 n=1 Tax=Anastrepha ludens TaxID=28586 RepID=UPI0023AEDC9E|nr:uncharacterized protein LOC128864352 [Anastrepha ludens]